MRHHQIPPRLLVYPLVHGVPNKDASRVIAEVRTILPDVSAAKRAQCEDKTYRMSGGGVFLKVKPHGSKYCRPAYHYDLYQTPVALDQQHRKAARFCVRETLA